LADDTRLMLDLQNRAVAAATAAVRQDEPDIIYVTIAVKQLPDQQIALGTGIGHVASMDVNDKGLRYVLKLAYKSFGKNVRMRQ
jgi:hypothetical protein